MRRGRGRRFEYVDADGRRVGDPEVLSKLAELAADRLQRNGGSGRVSR